MGRQIIDRTGYSNNGITMLSLHSTKTGIESKWNCKCHCGNIFITTYSRISMGTTKSCGCEKLHYKFIDDDYTYSTYNSMMQRCTNPNNTNYYKYGAIGIDICERWKIGGEVGFSNFLEDMGSRPQNTSLNRINSSTIYSKETCEWATATTQSYDQKIRKDNPSGRTGVKFRTDRNKWTSFIYVDKKYISLYYGDSEEEAISAREAAEVKYYGNIKGEK